MAETKKVQDKSKTIGKLSQKNDLQILYTNNFYQYSQEGSGVTYDLENSSGAGLYLKYDYWLEYNKNQLSFTYYSTNSAFKEPVNIGGKNVDIKRRYFNASYVHFLSKKEYSVELGMGYLTQSPSSFSNQQLVSDYKILGPSVGGKYKKLIYDRWTFTGKVSALIPIQFSEKQKTGYHDFSLYSQNSAMFSYAINEKLNFDVGVMLEYEIHKFSGTGERGVSDASDNYINYSIPIGITYLF